MLLGSSAVVLPADAASPRASITAPTVSGLTAPSSPLSDTAPDQFGVFATPSPGRTIAQVDFEYSPAGAGHWTVFATATTPITGSQYVAMLNTDNLPNGVYDFRAVATDSAGEQTASPVTSDLTVANAGASGVTYVAISSPGSPLSGTVNLTATPQLGGFAPDTVTFLYCPTSADCPANPGSWKTLATAGPQLDPSGNPTGAYVTTLDTTTLPDGSYDLGVSARDAAGDNFQGGAVSDLLVDNTSPTVTLANSGSSLSGVTTLTASATDAGSGVAAVKFQVAPAGTGNWTTVGVARGAPYSATFDTRQFGDGSYDLRAEATDEVGNTAASATAAGVAISNPGAQAFGGLTVTDYLPPATNIHLIGELPGAQHETWAVGQTNAPPPTVGGTPLVYTAQGNGQVVLLRYIDAAGWQIVDVLRNSDGSPFALLPGSSVSISGAMTASGEAWVTLEESRTVGGRQTNLFGVFHRLPGGPFQYDGGAEGTLQPLLPGTPTIRLGQAPDGTVYGTLQASTTPSANQSVMGPAGPVNITTQLEYGELVKGVWTLNGSSLPSGYTAPQGVSAVKLDAVDVTGPGTGWAALEQDGRGVGHPLILARFDPGGWSLLPQTGLDALDLSGPFDPGSQQSVTAGSAGSVPTLAAVALRADTTGVWLSATIGGSASTIVARYDAAAGRVVDSWCDPLPRPSSGCANPLDLDHPAAAPDAVFGTSEGPVAEKLGTGFLDVYYHGTWTTVATPGFTGGNGKSVFVDSTDGWLAGANTLGRVSAAPIPSPLASWPQANRNPLLSVALPPGPSTTDTPGALAVGLNGTALHYDAAAGWQVDATPAQTHHIELTGVAFAGPSLAFAVGQEGTILRWDGTSWTEDPQSVSLTTASLNAVAFGSGGQGWAVGALGTILHFDGTAWSPEQIDSQDVGANVTSVAVAGADVYAIASGNLVMRAADGTWQRVPSGSLPTPAPPVGSLQLVSGLPDGAVAVAGKSLLIVRQSPSAGFAYSPQSFSGIPVALAAFRDPTSGALQALISVAPPIQTAAGLSANVGGFPAGDGDLILETGSGWQDLSRDLPPASVFNAPGDGVVQPDPVLAVAASPDGSHAWAVGGYAGTHAADGVGTDQILSSRPAGWLTSAIWRYDEGGSASSQTTMQTPVSLPAASNTVSFAFFSSALCKVQCSAVQNAQPDVNLRAASTQIAAFAQQPGGPAFAMLGGDARGSMNPGTPVPQSDAIDLAHLPQLLAPLSGLPTYAAYGPLDDVPASPNPALPWAQAFGSAPAPFGSGPVPAGITPQGSGDPTASVHKYYAFDVAQNGGTLRAIVLDNSAGSLEASAPGQTGWLTGELDQAQAAGLPVVVFAADPLTAATDGDAVAAQLAAAGVLAVFTPGQGLQNAVTQVPAGAAPGASQIPEYEGATLTYQQSRNNGVLWYDVSVDTAARTLSVNAIPVISSLALEPLGGLAPARSSTLSFQAIGRRPPATIATTPLDSTFPGFSQYVGIPSSTCSGCIGPSYSFTSSDPVVGDFVVPTSPGSSFPRVGADGRTTHSSSSGLFCAFNSGTTTVTVTSGMLSASLPVTVQAGGFGPPCGTVPGGTSTNVIRIGGGKVTKVGALAALTGPPLVIPAHVTTPLPHISLPVAPAPVPAAVAKPAPVHHPAPSHVTNPAPVPSFLQSPSSLGVVAIVPPVIPPAVTPVPPGGATASAQVQARREEKARRHAQQSAYVIRPAGSSATDWFYPAVGAVTLLTLLLIAGGVRPGPDIRLARAQVLDSDREPSRPGRR